MSGRASERPGLAILTCEITPYRLHFHKRLAKELTEFQLYTVLFRDSAWSAWKLVSPAEINLVKLAEGDLKGRGPGRLGRVRSQLKRSAATLEFLRTHNIGAVVANGYDELPQLRAIRWCRAHQVPVMMWADSNIRSDHVAGLRKVAKNMIVPPILKRCDALIACGSLGRDYFERYGGRRERIFYSPYEPDYEQLERLDPSLIASTMERFGLRPERRRFVVSSRLVEHKRVDLAIDAFAKVASEAPEWDLVILGDGPLAASLKARVPEPLRTRVIFTGFVGQQEVVTAVYRGSHALVHPSNYEPWALVINEAAAAGLAIISTDVVGAAAELVREGENGHLIPANDVEALIRAMKDVATGGKLEKMRRASVDVLAAWRREADPVDGLRKALRAVGALTSP